MSLEALVLQLHLLEILLFGRDILAESVMLVKFLQRGDVGLALRGIIRTEEIELDVWDALNKEG